MVPVQQESRGGSPDPGGLDQVTGCSSRLCRGLLMGCALAHAICSQQAGSGERPGLALGLRGAAFCSTEKQRLKRFHVQAAGMQAGG